MKKAIKKFMSLTLLLIISFSLSGCFDNNVTVPPTYIEDYCYSITTDSETYNYGDEISIKINIQISPEGFYRIDQKDSGTLTLTLKDSDYFDIIGDKSIAIENILPKDYLCKNEENKYLSYTFKIKINEPTYIVKNLEITAQFTEYKDGEANELEAVSFQKVNFIADSQGIIIASQPYSFNHFGDEWPSFLNPELLLAKSYDREYLAGVSVEELLDRNVEYTLENEIVLGKIYNNDGTHTISYISKNARICAHLPSDHEYVNLYDSCKNEEQIKEFARIFLSLALKNSDLTENEYNAEIEYISTDNSTISFNKNTLYHVPTTEFEFPKGDAFYNYVINLQK